MVWERFSLKAMEAFVCDVCEEITLGEDPVVPGGLHRKHIYVQSSNRSMICQNCFDRSGKPKKNDIWGLM